MANVNLNQLSQKVGRVQALNQHIEAQERVIIIKMKGDRDPKEDSTVEMERVRLKKCSKNKLDRILTI